MPLRGRRLLVEKQHLQRFALLTQLDAFPAQYCPLSHVSPRSCCIVLFTLQKACYTHSVCFVPAKRLFIVVNVVFCCFSSSARRQGRGRDGERSFQPCGEFPLVGAVGGWPVGKPLGFALPLLRRVNRPGCRCPRRRPGLRRPWWPS